MYVDNVLITGSHITNIEKLKRNLDVAFTIKELACAHYFLRVEISHFTKGTSLSQRKYILDLLTETRLIGAKLNALPLPSGTTFSFEGGELLSDPEQYCKLLGKLSYFDFTRPDVRYGVNILS